MLTLGIPASAVMALMLGALTIQGIAPGPQVMTQKPDLFWGLVASMWVGNAMLVILNLPMVGMWVQLLKVPYRLLFPAIMAFSCIGIYSVNNSSMELYLTALFGVIGFFWMKTDCPPAPMLLGFVLGPLMEENCDERSRYPVAIRRCSLRARSAWVHVPYGHDPHRQGLSRYGRSARCRRRHLTIQSATETTAPVRAVFFLWFRAGPPGCASATAPRASRAHPRHAPWNAILGFPLHSSGVFPNIRQDAAIEGRPGSLLRVIQSPRSRADACGGSALTTVYLPVVVAGLRPA
jgi:hypothetical protein